MPTLTTTILVVATNIYKTSCTSINQFSIDEMSMMTTSSKSILSFSITNTNLCCKGDRSAKSDLTLIEHAGSV